MPASTPVSNTAILAWDSVADAAVTGYSVYYGTASGVYFQAVGSGISAGNVTTYTLTGLTRGNRYYFAVTAYDTAGLESGYSNEVSKVIP